MQPKFSANHETIRARLLRDRAAIDQLLRPDVVFSDDNLVLEELPSGQHAWLRPEPLDPDAPIPYVLTSTGRAAIDRGVS